MSWLPVPHLWPPLQRAMFKFKSHTSAVGFTLIQRVFFLKKDAAPCNHFPRRWALNLLQLTPRDPDAQTTVTEVFVVSAPKCDSESPFLWAYQLPILIYSFIAIKPGFSQIKEPQTRPPGASKSPLVVLGCFDKLPHVLSK